MKKLMLRNLRRLFLQGTLCSIGLLWVGACGETFSSNETGNRDGDVAQTLVSGLDTLNSAFQLSNLGIEPSATAKSYNQPKSFSFISSAQAALGTAGCLDSDPNAVIKVNCDESSHSAIITRSFQEPGCTAINPNGTTTRVVGNEYISWSNLGVEACLSNSTRPAFWTAVKSASTSPVTHLSSTDVSFPTKPISAIIRKFSNDSFLKVVGQIVTTFSNYSESATSQLLTGSLSIPAPGNSRVLFSSDGLTPVFDHTITTPQPLEFSLENTAGKSPVRTINKGTLAIDHNLAQFSVRLSFEALKYDYNQCECLPLSGTVKIDVVELKNTSNSIGSGSLVFNGCGEGALTYQGRAIRLPSFERCR